MSYTREQGTGAALRIYPHGAPGPMQRLIAAAIAARGEENKQL